MLDAGCRPRGALPALAPANSLMHPLDIWGRGERGCNREQRTGTSWFSLTQAASLGAVEFALIVVVDVVAGTDGVVLAGHETGLQTSQVLRRLSGRRCSSGRAAADTQDWRGLRLSDRGLRTEPGIQVLSLSQGPRILLILAAKLGVALNHSEQEEG